MPSSASPLTFGRDSGADGTRGWESRDAAPRRLVHVRRVANEGAGGNVLAHAASLLRSALKNPLVLAAAAAVVALGTFAFVTDAPAYAGTAPSTCANCHVMDSMYENYYHAAHRAWAVCADCHLPHQNEVAYYYEKG